MTERVKLHFTVPTVTVERFREHVYQEYDDAEGRLGAEATRALLEWTDRDAFATTEELLTRHAGGDGSGRPQNKDDDESGAWDDPPLVARSDVETERVTWRVELRAKEALRETVDRRNAASPEAADVNYGDGVARAFRSYIDGGRAARVDRKTRRLIAEHVDDAPDDPDELRDDRDRDADGSAEHVDRDADARTDAIVERVRSNFDGDGIPDHANLHDDTFAEEIEAVAGSDPKTLEKYRERVTDRLGLTRHPSNPTLWVSEETAEELELAEPWEVRPPTDALDRESRIRALALRVTKKAEDATGKKAKQTTRQIYRDWRDGAMSKQTARNDIEAAASRFDGFTVDRREGSKALKVNLRAVARSGDAATDLLTDVKEWSDAADGADGADESDAESGPDDTTAEDMATDTDDESRPTTPGTSAPARPARADGGTVEDMATDTDDALDAEEPDRDEIHEGIDDELGRLEGYEVGTQEAVTDGGVTPEQDDGRGDVV